MNILVLEDDLSSRTLTKQMVEQLGHRCLEADDGLSGLAIFERDRPEVVITDWMMPGTEGLSVCRQIREQDAISYTYVILLTTLDSQRHALAAMHAGADDYIHKPLSPDELERRLIAAERVVRMHAALASGGGATPEPSTQEPVAYDPTALRVMIADDDEASRDMVRAMLGGEQHLQIVAAAKDADEAVAMAKSKQPQVVVLDWDMPGGGGARAAEAIRDQVPDARMIALSASDSQEASFDMLRAGARDFLVKGASREQLIDSIRSAVKY